MVSIRSLDNVVVFLSVCILYHTLHADGRPLSRRSISEVQLMHTVGIHKHEQQRQQWLQVKMLELHTAPLSASGDRSPLPEHSDVTPSDAER
ncbi:hypothetical protein SRHO_G00118390 [Serrasalmus rhombeus]